jgi:glycosyltransferase involved in cell wall biosynthesis
MSETRVGVGMPVYNAERYLREAIDSFLGQTYPNFELTITDNASTDATEAICREYAARDARVRYHRSERNLGAIRNFRRAFALADGEYFAWAAHDDLRAPTFLEACVGQLDARPDAVLCCTGIRIIDAEGREIPESVWPPTTRPVDGTLRDRVLALARARYWYDFYGLIRRSALERTRLPIAVWGFDVVVLLELLLQGEIAYVPSELFWYRVFPEKQQSDVAHGLAAPGEEDVYTSWSELSVELLAAIGRAPLPIRERAVFAREMLVNFSLRNELVSRGIGHDGLASARRALTRRRPLRALELAALTATVDLTRPLYWLRRARARLGRKLHVRH